LSGNNLKNFLTNDWNFCIIYLYLEKRETERESNARNTDILSESKESGISDLKWGIDAKASSSHPERE